MERTPSWFCQFALRDSALSRGQELGILHHRMTTTTSCIGCVNCDKSFLKCNSWAIFVRHGKVFVPRNDLPRAHRELLTGGAIKIESNVDRPAARVRTDWRSTEWVMFFFLKRKQIPILLSYKLLPLMNSHWGGEQEIRKSVSSRPAITAAGTEDKQKIDSSYISAGGNSADGHMNNNANPIRALAKWLVGKSKYNWLDPPPVRKWGGPRQRIGTAPRPTSLNRHK